MFRTKRSMIIMDEMMEQEIISLAYRMIEKGLSKERVIDIVTNEYGDEAFEVVSEMLSEEFDDAKDPIQF